VSVTRNISTSNKFGCFFEMEALGTHFLFTFNISKRIVRICAIMATVNMVLGFVIVILVTVVDFVPNKSELLIGFGLLLWEVVRFLLESLSLRYFVG
jgi:hypothetical protein